MPGDLILSHLVNLRLLCSAHEGRSTLYSFLRIFMLFLAEFCANLSLIKPEFAKIAGESCLCMHFSVTETLV